MGVLADFEVDIAIDDLYAHNVYERTSHLVAALNLLKILRALFYNPFGGPVLVATLSTT